jgi:hypothetical protein
LPYIQIRAGTDQVPLRGARMGDPAAGHPGGLTAAGMPVLVA